MNQTYKPLKAGDVRRDGDESRSKHKVGWDCPVVTHAKDRVAEWRPASLLSQPILPSDLIHLEFRRPV